MRSMLKAVGTAIMILGLTYTLANDSQSSPAQATRASTGPGTARKLTLDLGNKKTLNLIFIPAGRFLMGSPAGEKHRDPDEMQHQVTITKPFYIGVTHVTVDQFSAFATDSGYKTEAEVEGGGGGVIVRDGTPLAAIFPGLSWRNPGFEQEGDHPVVQISLKDAHAFCEWLSKKSGKVVTLPTEAQWEYAARTGTKTAYAWGADPNTGKGWANCGDQSLKKKAPNTGEVVFTWDDGFPFTSPVAKFKPNAFGLHDMTGNAWQWCQDHYANFEKTALTDPKGPPTGRQYVLRGGAWNSDPRTARLAQRIGNSPVNRNYYGFRVAASTE